MDDPIVLGVFISSIATGLVILFLVLRYVLRAKSRREAAASSLERDANGVMTVPVLATFTGLKGWPALIALASNSLNPVLIIRPDRLNYRVTRLRCVVCDQIESISLLTAPGTVNLVFVFRTGPFTLSANVGTVSVAQTVLDGFPALAAKRICPSDVNGRTSAQADSPHVCDGSGSVIAFQAESGHAIRRPKADPLMIA